MRVIAVIEDQKVIRKILAYLGLWQIKARPRPVAHAPPQLAASACDDWPAPSASDWGRRAEPQSYTTATAAYPEAGSYPKKKVSFAKRQGTCYFFPDATDIRAITKKIDYLHSRVTDSDCHRIRFLKTGG